MNNRGLAYKSLGRLDEARRDFDQALALKPEDTRAASNRASLDKFAAAAAPPAAPPSAREADPFGSDVPESGLKFLYRANFFRITCSGSSQIGISDGTIKNVDIPIGGTARYGFPVQWSGDEFFYSGPSFEIDAKRHPPGWTGGNINLPTGSHLVLGKISADGNRLLSLRMLTRGGDGHVFAIELRNVDLRNRQPKFDDTTLFLSNYSQSSKYSKAAEMFQSTVKILDINGKWTNGGTVNLLEYRPFGLSVSLFRDPDVPAGFGSKQPLPEVRKSLDTYWSGGASWARVSALSEERLRAMFPR